MSINLDRRQHRGSKSNTTDRQDDGSSFEPNAILRGAQLTVVGALRALQNPELFRSDVYRQARIAVGAGLAIKLLIEAPVFILRLLLSLLAFASSVEEVRHGHEIVEGLSWVLKSGLQLQYVLIGLLNIYLLQQPLDDVFWLSLRWVDATYIAKHEGENRMGLKALYSENLATYPADGKRGSRGPKAAARDFLLRFGRKAGISLVAFLLSFVPHVGRFSLPLASFATFKDAVGPMPAGIVFTIGLLLPRSYLASFLQIYYGSRSLMRELVSRDISDSVAQTILNETSKGDLLAVKFVDINRMKTSSNRGYYADLVLRIPIVGVLIYGLAEASTAYLITKVVDPPPPLPARTEYAAEQVVWRNRKNFLDLHLGSLDADRRMADPSQSASSISGNFLDGKKFA